MPQILDQLIHVESGYTISADQYQLLSQSEKKMREMDWHDSQIENTLVDYLKKNPILLVRTGSSTAVSESPWLPYIGWDMK